ncbi:MAG: HlyD family efflux transporter periplasmic adaptor subunit [Pirellulales bacterium]|nr:HlyD family efflux transporter periplasmic adaptor subunit [Pirellulales bacterium]
MSTEQSYQPEAVDQTRQQIRGLVREIESLARSEVTPEEFYEGFLHRIVAALAAIGGAVWTFDDDGHLTLSSHLNLGETGLVEKPEDQQRHGKLLRKILDGGQDAIVQPQYTNPEDDVANPTDLLLVCGILKSDQEVRGLVEVFQRTGSRAAVQRGYLTFVKQMCEVAEDFLKTRQLRLFTDRQAIWTQLEQFTRVAHSSLEPRAAAYAIANEGRRLIESDRVSIAIRRGGRCSIEAVSGQETFDKRSNTVVLLGKLATVVVKAGEPLWYLGDTRDLAPQIEEAVEAYVDESHSKNIVVLPLAKPRDEEEIKEHPDRTPDFVGALIVEQINTDGIPAAMRRRIDVVAEHGSVALGNALEHNNLFLMPVWRTIGKSKVLVGARMLPKTLAVVGLVLAAVLSLFLIPADFDLHGKGTLEPVVQREVFAPDEGIVTDVLVEHGQTVAAGQELVKLDSTEIDTKIIDINGKIRECAEKIANAAGRIATLDMARQGDDQELERVRIEGERQAAQQMRGSLERQLELLKSKKNSLIVKSPINGTVVTWKPKDKLNARPVGRGEVLLRVADTSQDWELEVRMPEDRMGHIRRAQHASGREDLKVSYILATDPNRTLYGTIKDIEESAEVVQEEGNTVKVRVTINKGEMSDDVMRPDAAVSAKINCGRRSLGYCWFHDVFEFIQSKIFFRW